MPSKFTAMEAVNYRASHPDAMFVLAADCNAYEARIAELEAEIDNANAIATWVDGLQSELARVKAESLRVVECECQDMNISSDWYMTPSGLGWLGYDKHDVERVETPDGYHQFADCKKVRLERWETAE